MGNCYYGPYVDGRVARDSGCGDAVSTTKLNQQNKKQQRKTFTTNRKICICDACGKIGLISHQATKVHSSLQSIDTINLGEINSSLWVLQQLNPVLSI